MDFWCHPTAIVDAGARVGCGTRIWHWTHICATAVIGARCSLGQNVYVGNEVSIGNNVRIQNNVSIYDAVCIEDDVFCGPSMVFTNVHNPRAEFPRKDAYRPTLVRRGASIGANATLVCGVTLGEYSFIGAGAVVADDVAPFALMVGVPAIQIGWVSRFGERIPLPLAGDGEWRCVETGDHYRLQAGSMYLERRGEVMGLK